MDFGAQGPSNQQAPHFTAEKPDIAKDEVGCPALPRQFQEG